MPNPVTGRDGTFRVDDLPLGKVIVRFTRRVEFAAWVGAERVSELEVEIGPDAILDDEPGPDDLPPLGEGDDPFDLPDLPELPPPFGPPDWPGQ